MTKDLRYITIMLEEERDERKVLSEAVSHILHVLDTQVAKKDDLSRLEAKVDTMQLVLTETNKDVKILKQDVKRLDHRVGRLEHAHPSTR
jgi:ubiquinone biosynthesis protein UbiJ